MSRPSKLIHVEVATVPDSIDTLTSYDVSCIRNNLGRNRRAKLPALPKSTEDIQKYLMDTIIKTTKNEDFLLVNDPQSKIVVFSTRSNIEFMCGYGKFYMDGTFQFCPKYFHQLFTIHVYANGHYIPVLFCLLVNKQQQTYRRMFQFINSKCRDLGYTWNLEEAVIDFEIAISNAIKEVFPAVKITGCRFHLAQAW